MVMSIVNSDESMGSPPHKVGSQSKREQKRRPKPKDGTVLYCGVCGDRALGYNFDAISCESCKAFFRRNALKAKPFTCSFEGNCKLDPHTRKFCSGCRLKKCFTVGMKKEWILNEDQLVKRRKRQQTRQLGPHHQDGPTTDIQPCSSTSNDLMDESSTPYLPREYHSPGLPHHRHLLPSSTCHSGSDSSDYMPHTPASYYDSHPSSATSPVKGNYSLSYGGSSSSPTSTTSPPANIPLIPGPSPPQMSPSVREGSAAKLPKLEYISEDEDCYYGRITKPVSRDQNLYASRITPTTAHQDPVGSSDELSNCSTNVKSEMSDDSENYVIPLDPYIRSQLLDMRKVYDDIFEAAYTPDQLPKLTEKPKTANQLFNMTDVFIRRLIKFAKHIPEFKNLSQTDQIHLLKGGIMEMFVLRSAMGFDSKNNAWKFKVQPTREVGTPHMEGKVDPSVINTLSSSMFMQHMDFVRQLQEVANKDRIVLMLLFVIELMSPDRANLVDKHQVSQSQERLSMWLRAYLESVHTVADAKIIYPKLLVKLLDVRNLGEESCQMASQLDITNLEPLLVEVFDLNR